MFYTPTYQIDLEWTLKLCVRKPDVAEGWTHAYVQDLDATLIINYWAGEGENFDWQIAQAKIDGIKVTDDSDPLWWGLIERARRMDFDHLNEVVQERIKCSEAA